MRIRIPHGAELVDIEEAIAPAHPALMEKDGAAIVHLDRNGHGKHHGAQNEKSR